MAQVDLLNYFPILFWSMLSLLFFYFLIFTYVLPLMFAALKVRLYFHDALITNLMRYNYFFICSSLLLTILIMVNF